MDLRIIKHRNKRVKQNIAIIFKGSNSLNCFIQYLIVVEQPGRWWKKSISKFLWLPNAWFGDKPESHVPRALWTCYQCSSTGLHDQNGASPLGWTLHGCCLKFLMILSLSSCFVSKGQWDSGTCCGGLEPRVTHCPISLHLPTSPEWVLGCWLSHLPSDSIAIHPWQHPGHRRTRVKAEHRQGSGTCAGLHLPWEYPHT